MSKCYLTKKTTLFGNKRSHAMNSTRRKWKSNLHKIRILDNKGKMRKIYISARALKKNELKII
ncbi:50S ribosomal protein L28 [Candidatus Phytoplasma sacchari]|uniref:Large ribosomal subunit protein bL28 n=1 Tax=Candidatus Phytoplasma sacchari TaxID=2609813 RepID=A0ABY7M440_9MOLU|nr:50S ribosomal protein L28 [Candidatus Phytoplasma sacchari]KAB8122773.1 50S ribosomal protein L28 [Candidatus Phytoplasma sacchari]WBL31416.1 50S ribosomal protein L28 [Candidatus Phytoplasma sacchari]